MLALNEEVVHHLAPMDEAEYRWFLAEAAGAWAAEVDGELAAFVLLMAPGSSYESRNYAWFQERYDDFLYLDRVAVQAHHRRTGVGSAVYEAVEAEAARRGVPVLLEVNVVPRNDPSLAFHDARGYLEVGQLEHPGGKVTSMRCRPTTTATTATTAPS